MLRDIKLEDNESWNIERFASLINVQRIFYYGKGKYCQATQTEAPYLEDLVKKAIEKGQWRLALLLLTSPCTLTKKFIQQLVPHKHFIINKANLTATTHYGQYILTRSSLLDIENKTTNLSRLAYAKSGYLPARKFGYFSKQPVGALGKICIEIQRRSELKDDKIRDKNTRIAENIIRCAGIDAATGSVIGRSALSTFNSLFTRYLDNPTCYSSGYNPLLPLFEVVMLLMDKGFNKPLEEKDQTEQFHALKILLDSPEVSEKAIGCYNHNYEIHIKIHSDQLDFLETIFHEFTHALCKIIYDRTDTTYATELRELADALKKFYLSQSDPATLNFFSQYPERQYAEELFPRVVQLYIQSPQGDFQDYPYEIRVMLDRLFAQFIRDIAEFKVKLVELQSENKWSRIASSKALEAKDYKSYFSMVTTSAQSSMNELPLFSTDSKLVTMAIEKGFSIYSTNKFKKNVLQMFLEDKYPNFYRALNILEKIREVKATIPTANLDVRDSGGMTLLMTAILEKRNPEFIKWLIVEAGVDVSIADFGKYTAGDYAGMKGLVEIQKLIELFLNPGGPGLDTLTIG